jgi:hypothetical protein
VLEQRDRLISLLRARQAGEIDAGVGLALSNEFRRDGEQVEDHVIQTVAQYYGERLDDVMIRTLATQLAARSSELLEGPLAKFGLLAVSNEWIPMEVLSVEPAIWRDDAPGALLRLECLYGRPAGHVFPRKFPEGWLRYLAYQIGYSRRVEYPDDSRLFVGLRFWGHMIAAQTEDKMDFSDWATDAQTIKHNKQIIKLRHRFDRDDVDCPYELDCECVDCPKTQRACIAAFRRSTPANEAGRVRSQAVGTAKAGESEPTGAAAGAPQEPGT